MKYVVVLPWVYEPYMQDCLASCKLDNILLVDNTVTNLGVSRSWNLGIDKLQSEKADWLIVLSASVRFGQHGGLDFIEQLEHYQHKTLAVEATGLFGWHLVAFSRECIHRVGRFDENMFPGYYADLDYLVRFQRYFNEDFAFTPPPTQKWRQVGVDATDMGMAHGLKLGGVTGDADPIIDYFRKKWGRHPDHPYDETYDHPFDSAANPIGFWPSVVIDSIPGRWDTPAIPDFIDADKTTWKTTAVNAIHETSYEFELPWPLCEWENLANWEHERFESMRTNLHQGDVFYEVGAECGWCSLIPAIYVGGENMVLVEPSKAQWPNIRHTWQHNDQLQPLACYNGFISTDTTDHQWTLDHRQWPLASNGPLSTHIAFKHLFNDYDETPSITFDSLVNHVGRPPDAINIDVEGAEVAVLESCAETLRTHHPKVWVSIHPDLMAKWYDTKPDDVHRIMSGHGYHGVRLAVDHEEHWFFEVSQ